MLILFEQKWVDVTLFLYSVVRICWRCLLLDLRCTYVSECYCVGSAINICQDYGQSYWPNWYALVALPSLHVTQDLLTPIFFLAKIIWDVGRSRRSWWIRFITARFISLQIFGSDTRFADGRFSNVSLFTLLSTHVGIRIEMNWLDCNSRLVVRTLVINGCL